MKLDVQKKLAAKVLDISKKRAKIDLDTLEALGITLDDFKQSITKADIRGYIAKGVIRIIPKRGVSRVRAKERRLQRAKGRQRGPGNRKGTKNARLPKKGVWMNRIRDQRQFIKILKEKKVISNTDYWGLYQKAKGGFFRSRRHIRLFAEEHRMIKQ